MCILYNYTTNYNITLVLLVKYDIKNIKLLILVYINNLI